MRLTGLIWLTALLLVAAWLPTGCEFSSGGDGFNTSRGAGVNVNISGFYEGLLGGGKAVDTSSGNVNHLTISQAGNRLDVTDNQGSSYQGSVGVPDVFVNAAQGEVIPATTQIMQFQVNWQGKDGVAAQDVQFVGAIDVVTITEVKGTAQTSTRTLSRTTNANTAQSRASNSTTTETSATGTNGNQQIIEDIGDGTNIVGSISIRLGATTSEATVDASLSQGGDTADAFVETVETTTTTNFELTPGNTRFRLRGTWVENGGRASSLSAQSTGSGLLSATAVSTATSTTAN